MATQENKPLNQIVDENYVNAYVLHYFGISFYEYSDKTLEQVCQEKGLKLQNVLAKLEQAANNKFVDSNELLEYSVEVVVAYLKHMHHIFVTDKLTYLSKLIINLVENSPIISDLKFVFPLFVQDFIEHLHEEEDTFFNYILLLNKTVNAGVVNNVVEIQKAMSAQSLQHFALHHHQHDDVMKGIRQITENYAITPELSVHLKVIFEELKKFESDLILHAKIENEILFPKALVLEREVKDKISKLAVLN